MKIELNRKFLIAGIVLLAFFAVMTVLVCLGITGSFDKAIVEAIYELRGNHSEPRGAFFWINRVLTEAGYIYVLIPSCVLALVVGKGKPASLFLSLGTGIAWCINNGIKSVIVRERPDVMYRMMAESSSSFPSGHSMNSAFFYFMLSYVIYKSNINKKLKVILMAITICMPFVIGLTRINLTVHFFTDVVSGLMLGGALVCLSIAWLEKYGNKKKQNK